MFSNDDVTQVERSRVVAKRFQPSNHSQPGELYHTWLSQEIKHFRVDGVDVRA